MDGLFEEEGYLNTDSGGRLTHGKALELGDSV